MTQRTKASRASPARAEPSPGRPASAARAGRFSGTGRARAASRALAAELAQDPDLRATLAKASLRYSRPTDRGIRREGGAERFRYVDADARRIRDTDTIARIRALAIPPAWTSVWICEDPQGHLQATGRDARGRLQYRYHAQWRARRDEHKFGRLAEFALALPAIREAVARDLSHPGLPRRKLQAAMVRLLDRTFVRVGDER